MTQCRQLDSHELGLVRCNFVKDYHKNLQNLAKFSNLT